MSDVWSTIAALSLLAVATKGAGPLILGGHDLHDRFMRVIELLSTPVLAALVVVGTLTSADGDLTLDARAGGLAAAAAVLAIRRGALLSAVAAAAVVAALIRALA